MVINQQLEHRDPKVVKIKFNPWEKDSELGIAFHAVVHFPIVEGQQKIDSTGLIPGHRSSLDIAAGHR